MNILQTVTKFILIYFLLLSFLCSVEVRNLNFGGGGGSSNLIEVKKKFSCRGGSALLTCTRNC